jgi:transcriptional regulator
MARQDSLQGSLPLLVLKILARRGPLHGYGITTQIENMSEEVLRVEEGSLYPALHRMEEAGWIKAKWVTTENNRRARLYEITAAGRKQLEAEQLRWQAVTAAVGYILEHA